MLGILSTQHGLYVRASPCALHVDAYGLPEIPVTAGVVVEYGVANPYGIVLHGARQLPHERQANVILCVDGLRLGQPLADHFGKLLHPDAVDLGEVDSLRHVAIESGRLADETMKIGVGGVAVQLAGFSISR